MAIPKQTNLPSTAAARQGWNTSGQQNDVAVGATPYETSPLASLVPLAQSFVDKAKMDYKMQNENKANIAQAMIQMGMMGTPQANPNAPTMDLPGVGPMAMLPKPTSGADALASVKAASYGQMTDKDIADFLAKTAQDRALTAMMTGAAGDATPDKMATVNMLKANEAFRKRERIIGTYSEAELERSMAEKGYTREEAISEFATWGYELEEA